MPRFSRRFAPRKHDKHEVTWSSLAQNASAVQTVTLAVGVASADKDAATEVEVGSHVYGVYIEFNISAEDTTSTKILHWNVVVVDDGQTPPNPNQYYQAQRSQVLQRGMEMLNRTVNSQTKRIVFVRIPKKAQRMKQNSAIYFRYIVSSTETVNVCGIAIYKELY